MIRDQADLLATDRNPSAVRARWIEVLTGPRPAGAAHELTNDGRQVLAYVSDNRWVADCLHCRGGIETAPWNPHACCLWCGRIFTVVFPKDAAAGEKLLLARADPHTRHWFPDRESVADLARENEAMMGVTVTARATEVEHLIDVKADFDSELADDLLATLETGYTIRWDAAAGIAHVALVGKTDREVAAVKRALKI